MKTLILYYSYGGNTRGVAQRIQKGLGCDIAEIKTVTPYSASYDAVVEQGQQEVNSGYKPAIQPLAVNPEDYDTILLGMPVWWYTFAPAVNTVLSTVDLSGKTIYPFATNGGWIGHTFKDVAHTCAGARVKQGLNIAFDGNRQGTPDADVTAWVEQIIRENA